jgi:hypothetical protein
MKIVKNHSEGRVKLDSEDNKTIQNEKVPVKKLEVIINRGHNRLLLSLLYVIFIPRFSELNTETFQLLFHSPQDQTAVPL